MVSDGLRDIVASSFSPQTGFTELVRIRDRERTLTTPPVVLSDGNTVVGTGEGSLMFAGLTLNQPGAIGGLGMLTAAPTRLDDGRLAVVSRNGTLRLLSGNSITHQEEMTPPGAMGPSEPAEAEHSSAVGTPVTRHPPGHRRRSPAFGSHRG